MFIAATSSRAQIRALAAKTPALHMRGKVLVQWARHLNAAYAGWQASTAWQAAVPLQLDYSRVTTPFQPLSG